MKCARCSEEIVLAEKCPYCGEPASPPKAAAPGSQAGPGGEAGPDQAVRRRTWWSGRAGLGSRKDDQVRSTGASAGPRAPRDRKGEFKGRLGHGSRRSQPQGTVGRLGWLFLLGRYFLDRRVEFWKKALIVASVLYIVSPIDFLPEFMPLIGWLDDAVTAAFLWRLVSGELARYRERLT